MYSLFLDDTRHPSEVTWIKLPDVKWYIVKSYDEFVDIINRLGIPTRVTFDHDLADEHYKQVSKIFDSTSENPDVYHPFDYTNLKEKTGYHACQYLIEYCLEKKLPLPEIFVHTMNPVGRENILSLINSYKKSQSLN